MSLKLILLILRAGNTKFHVECPALLTLSFLSKGQDRNRASLRDGQQERIRRNLSSFKPARLLQPCHKPRSAFAERGFLIPLFPTAVFPGPETKTKLPFHTLCFCPSAPYPSCICLFGAPAAQPQHLQRAPIISN